MIIACKVWYNNYWIKFTINSKNYQNVITFLDNCKLSFLYTNKIDFSKIPVTLHGKGFSNNLLDYLSNNADNNTLIIEFIKYFLTEIYDFKYYGSDEDLRFSFSDATEWQNLNIYISSEFYENSYVENGYVDDYFQ